MHQMSSQKISLKIPIESVYNILTSETSLLQKPTSSFDGCLGCGVICLILVWKNERAFLRFNDIIDWIRRKHVKLQLSYCEHKKTETL